MKKNIIRYGGVAAIFLLVFGFVFLFSIVHRVRGEPTPTPTEFIENPEKSLGEIEDAIFNELRGRREGFVYSAFETRLARISISADGKYASAWMILIDPSTGQTIPSEPGLALLHLEFDSWKVALPGDPEWDEWLAQSPASLLGEEERAFWQEINTRSAAAVPAEPLSGYLLPWEGGKTAYLSGSVSHDAYIPSGNAHYAFDFYVPGTSSSVMFDLYAARAGTVWRFRDSQVNHSEESPGNYLVVKDTTTTPTTYQLYLHLAQGSIPSELKTAGALVTQGQFIGIADDTGASTGNHVHFHVHTNPDSYWGRSVDITFDDVFINGGRPRVKNQFYNDEAYCTWPDDVCDTFQSDYVSGNRMTSPASVILALAPVQQSNAFRLAWSSQEGVSAIDHFDIQINVDVQGWQDLLLNIPGNVSSQWITVDPGHLYAFRIRAVDVSGNVEVYPDVEDTVTLVQDAATLCSNTDLYEIDNTSDTAQWFSLDGTLQNHNFCNPLLASYEADSDWIRIQALANQGFSVLAIPPVGSPAQVNLTLYLKSGQSLNELDSAISPGYGTAVWIHYVPASDGEYYLRMTSQDERIIGEGAKYQLWVNSGTPDTFWLPVINR